MPTPTAPQRPQRAAPAGGMSPAVPAAPAAPPRRFSSEALFGAMAVEIEIEHQQQVYRLRRTSLGKLILTK